MNEKMPYYMAYPTPLSFDDERTERMDFEYLKSMYPELPKRILPYVEEECDRMEYENSMMYDQYPDKLQLKMMCRRVCDNVRRHERLSEWGEAFDQEENEESAVSGSACSCRGAGCSCRGSDKGILRDLVEVMLFQELYRRRCDHRRRCRRFY